MIRFGFNNPYMDKDYRILGVAFLLIDFFVEIMADSFKNVLKRGYLDELISTCKHAMLVFLATALFLFTTQMADIYSRLSFLYHVSNLCDNIICSKNCTQELP